MKTFLISIILSLFFLCTKSQTAPVILDTLSPAFSAVALAMTPDSAMVYLGGKAIVDSRSVGQISFLWFAHTLPTGAKITIDSPDSLGTRVRGLIPGTYNFGLIVKDNRANLSDTAY